MADTAEVDKVGNPGLLTVLGMQHVLGGSAADYRSRPQALAAANDPPGQR
jgi:hypothetical protein